MGTLNPLDGHPPNRIWSPTFLKIVTHFPKDGHQPSPGWSPTIPRMVTNNTQDGHPPSKGGLATIQNLVTHQPEKECPEGSITVPWIWSHTILWWSPSNSHHHPWDCYHFPSKVTHYLQDGQLYFEYNTSAAKLVNIVACLAQLVSLSVAFPAKLVSSFIRYGTKYKPWHVKMW